MIVAIPTLEVALDAMDKLNSFARNPNGRGPRRAIYWLKSRYAVRDAIMAGMLTKMRAIQVTTKCHKCSDGIYTDWDGVSRGMCYTCGGTAKVTLKFIETTIGKYVWHHPTESYNSGWQGWPTDDLEFSESQDWTVKSEGRDLTNVELATCMNIVETRWQQWRKQSPYELSRDEDDSHRYYIFNYSLDLGYDSDVRGCALCGGQHHVYCTSTFAPGLQRHFSVCAACEKDAQIWTRLRALPMPQLHHEIQLWRERHTIDFEQTWGRHWHDKWNWNKVENTIELKAPCAA